MDPTDRTDSSKLDALTNLLREAVKPPRAAELQQGLNALRVRNATKQGAPRWRWAALAAALLAGVVVTLGTIQLFSSDSHPAEHPVALDKIEGGKLLDGGYLSEVGQVGIKLLFNEGSRFELAPGARGRLRSVAAEGTRLALEHGKASFRIVESRNRHWAVEAGPFEVAVRGTDFAVEWDPVREELAVDLRRGRVAVSGPVVGEQLILRPGQRLTVSLPKRQSVLSEGAVHPPPAASVTEASPTPPALSSEATVLDAPALDEAPSASSGPAAPASARPPNARSWKAAIATGQWDRILADVERDGLATTLRTLSSEDLFALADAARYRRRTDLARAALVEHRRRFPQSPRSLDALFLLGRVEEAGQRGKRLAIQRYREYLTRAPGGTYSAEALGRSMILTRDVEGAASARQIAEEYLRRFPNGSYAEAARALRQVP